MGTEFHRKRMILEMYMRPVNEAQTNYVELQKSWDPLAHLSFYWQRFSTKVQELVTPREDL
jgi:hypothetical protein